MEIYSSTIKFTPARKPLVQTQSTYPASFNILKDRKLQKKQKKLKNKLLLAQKAKSMNGDSGSIAHLFHPKSVERKEELEKCENIQNGSVNGSILSSPVKFVNGSTCTSPEKLVNGHETDKKVLNGSCNGSVPLINGSAKFVVIKPSSASNIISPTSNGVRRPLVEYSDSDEDSDCERGGDSPAKVIVRSRIVSVRETTSTHSTLPACTSSYSFPPFTNGNGPEKQPHSLKKEAPASPKKKESSPRSESLSFVEDQKPCSSSVETPSAKVDRSPVAKKMGLFAMSLDGIKALLPNVIAKKSIVDDGNKNCDISSAKKFEGFKLLAEEKPEFSSSLPASRLESSKMVAGCSEKKIIGPTLPEVSKLGSGHNGEKRIILNIPSSLKNGEIAGKLVRSESAPSMQTSLKRPFPSDGIKDGPLPQRKRVLSERGEEERKHPIIDRSVIAHWRWTNANRFGNRRAGCGFLNFSNDCFLNSVVQVVIHTAPLAHFIMSHKMDPIRCRKHDQICIMCRLKSLIHDSFNGNGKAIQNTMIKCTKQFFKSHRRGTQADAHEALLLLLDAMDGVALPGVKSKSTPSEQIFGMTLRYRGVCKTCGKDSNGYERVRVLELCMDKWRPTNTTELLKNFFKNEQLGDYKCEKCNSRGNYSRRTQLLRAPAILILQIQRFSFMRKVKEEVIPLTTIDLQPYLVDSESQDIHGPAQYTLKGVVDHLGFSIDSGHYRAFHVDTHGEQWVEFDDEMVQRMDLISVKRQVKNGCYLMIYHRKSHA